MLAHHQGGTPVTASGWHVPFEDQPPGLMADVADCELAGALVVMGVVVASPMGQFPALVFRFEDAQHRMMRPVLLVLDAEHLNHVPAMVAAAAASAARGARQPAAGAGDLPDRRPDDEHPAP